MLIKNTTKGHVHLGPNGGLLGPGEMVEIDGSAALGVVGNGIVECGPDGQPIDFAGIKRTAVRAAARASAGKQAEQPKVVTGGGDAPPAGGEGAPAFPEVTMPEADAKGFITKAQGIELAEQFGMSGSAFGKIAKEIPGTKRDGDKANSPLLIPAKAAMTFLANWWKEQHAEG